MPSTFSHWRTPLLRVVLRGDGYFSIVSKSSEHKHLRNTLILQNTTIYGAIKNFKKNLHILEDGASSVQVNILNM